jgi:hypothetical protein
MLRPTSSSIIFVQQLGRGLRKITGKEYLTVIDFIGNYKNNYMIPMALSGNVSRDKNNLRKDTFDTNFILGTLSHYNFPITGPASGANLRISLTFTSAGQTISPTFSYGFNIDETTNASSVAGCNPAKQISSVPCDDIITPIDPQPQTFTLNNRQYQITIPGFSENIDGSSSLEKFTTVERLQNDAYLVGQLTDITPVPWETDALSVVGTTILFAGGVWRKHKLGKKTLDKD